MHILIIGNGISGITAARYIRKQSDYQITVVSKESPLFFSRTALMYIYMGHMRLEDIQPYANDFWTKNKIDLLQAEVTAIDFVGKKIEYSVNKHSSKQYLNYDQLILALGSAPNKFGWPGQDLLGVQGLYTLQDLNSMEVKSKNLNQALIVGGGLIGIEMAEMLHTRNIPVTLLVRETYYWDNILPKEEAIMVSGQIRNHGFDLRLKTELKEIKGDKTGQAIGVVTNHGEEIPCQFVGLTAGVHPNVAWLKKSPLKIEKGIVVNQYLQSNLDDVYAIGDCAQIDQPRENRRSIEPVWYTGRIMGETVAYNVCGKPVVYDPGVWFNSAKFLDLEYQTYGNVLPQQPKNHESLLWQDTDKEKLIRLVYDVEEKYLIGINLLGIRFRHEVCEKWISTKTSIETVLQQLALADFNPEFTDQYSADIVHTYNQKYGTNIHVNKERKFNQVFRFLQEKFQK